MLLCHTWILNHLTLHPRGSFKLTASLKCAATVTSGVEVSAHALYWLYFIIEIHKCRTILIHISTQQVNIAQNGCYPHRPNYCMSLPVLRPARCTQMEPMSMASNEGMWEVGIFPRLKEHWSENSVLSSIFPHFTWYSSSKVPEWGSIFSFFSHLSPIMLGSYKNMQGETVMGWEW